MKLHSTHRGEERESEERGVGREVESGYQYPSTSTLLLLSIDALPLLMTIDRMDNGPYGAKVLCARVYLFHLHLFASLFLRITLFCCWLLCVVAAHEYPNNHRPETDMWRQTSAATGRSFIRAMTTHDEKNNNIILSRTTTECDYEVLHKRVNTFGETTKK